MNCKELIDRLKYMIKSASPDSQAILYGSEARGEAKQNSDIDILILVDKDVLSPVEEDVITAPIYDLEIETGTVISPIVMTRKAWDAAKRKTMFYYNVMKDGVLL
ncbi:nucleotidyltransferase domain-containing protein [Bacteroides fluxus]|uniref:nucleotidyltransferase domain-containing protein n=1 Tax=Bacteroides fluxus TaxID=626930 RepID=UPI002357DC96|nr:nucleotidyltransferase domain-containing protein [Bacteroides fluxus]